MLDKFSFQDDTMEKLSFLDPRNRLHFPTPAVLLNAKRFVIVEHELDLDSLSL